MKATKADTDRAMYTNRGNRSRAIIQELWRMG